VVGLPSRVCTRFLDLYVALWCLTFQRLGDPHRPHHVDCHGQLSGERCNAILKLKARNRITGPLRRTVISSSPKGALPKPRLVLVGLCEGNQCRGGRKADCLLAGACNYSAQVLRFATIWARSIFRPIAVRGLQQPGRTRRPAGGALPTLFGTLGWRLQQGSWAIADEGRHYDLPRDENGRKQYGNAEGVSWLDDEHLVVVSDQAKERRFQSKERSVHIFALP
jgi:hypothetical protein